MVRVRHRGMNIVKGEETLLGYILSDSYIKPSPRTPDIQRHEETV